MARSSRFAAAAVVILALGSGLALLVENAGDPKAPSSAVAEPTLGPLPQGARGCRGRVEGGKLTAVEGRDTTVGPVSFLGARSAHRSMARSRHLSKGAENLYPDFPGHGLKVVALVDSGEQVSLRVPREQRRWMRLVYDLQGRTTTAITLRACRRFTTREEQERECGWGLVLACKWQNTQFSGGFVIALDRAPARGRCAELWVRVRGEKRTRRQHLFEPEPERCARTVELSTRGRLPAGSVEYTDRRHDLRVSVPPGWHRARRTIAPRLAKPADILAVGNFLPRAEPEQACTSAPDSPQLRVGPRDALVFVTQERHPQAQSGLRQPTRFRLEKQIRPVGRGGPDRRPGQVFPWACLNRVGISGLWKPFWADGRVFYVTAIVGEAATRALREETLGVLESIEFGSE